MGNNPAHLIGIETKNTFNGTWGTDANWHKIFYKDIKAHEMFTGTFEAEKTMKFHENPVPEKESSTLRRYRLLGRNSPAVFLFLGLYWGISMKRCLITIMIISVLTACQAMATVEDPGRIR